MSERWRRAVERMTGLWKLLRPWPSLLRRFLRRFDLTPNALADLEAWVIGRLVDESAPDEVDTLLTIYLEQWRPAADLLRVDRLHLVEVLEVATTIARESEGASGAGACEAPDEAWAACFRRRPEVFAGVAACAFVLQERFQRAGLDDSGIVDPISPSVELTRAAVRSRSVGDVLVRRIFWGVPDAETRHHVVVAMPPGTFAGGVRDLVEEQDSAGWAARTLREARPDQRAAIPTDDLLRWLRHSEGSLREEAMLALGERNPSADEA